jgi:hypothetical protein
MRTDTAVVISRFRDLMSVPRIYRNVAATLGWATLALQLYLTVTLARANGLGTAEGVIRYFSYFTILTNILVAFALTWPQRPAVVAGIATSISLVCITYNLVLRQLWHPTGLSLIADELLHVVMPVVFVVYWLVLTPKGHLRWTHVAWWALYPIGYLLLVLARATVSGFYPYPFIDVSALGYGRALLNGVGVLAVFVGLGLFAIAIDRRRRSPVL